MPLTQLSLDATLTWTLTLPITGFADLVQGSDSAAQSLSGISLVTWDELFAAQYTIAPAGTQTVDLRSFTDLTGVAVTGTKSLLLDLSVTGAAADVLNIKPGAVNGLQWFFENASYGVNLPGGASLLYSLGALSAGQTIDATHRNLLLTNGGAADLVVRIAVVVSDV